MSSVFAELDVVVARVSSVPVPRGLGSGPVLDEGISYMAGALNVLQRELALWMAAREAQAPTEGPADTRRQAVMAGMPEGEAQSLRAVGKFASGCPTVQRAWRGGHLSREQVHILRKAANTLPEDQAAVLVERVVPLLRGLDARGSRRLVEIVVDQLAPEDPEEAERAEYAARHLTWTGISDGLTFQGSLPRLEGAAFKAAIEAMAASLRVAGDGVRVGQRRADALAAIIVRAAAHGLPTGGGLPAAVTLTVPLGEAERIATRNPAAYGCTGKRRPRGPAMVDDPPHGPTRTIGDAAVRFALCATAITPMIIGPRAAAGAGHGPHIGTATTGGGSHTEARGHPPAAGTRHPRAMKGAASPPGATGTVGCACQAGAADRGSFTGPAGMAAPVGSAWATGSQGSARPSEPSGQNGSTWSGAANVGRDPESALRLISSTPEEPLAVGRAVRLATSAQRRALQQRDDGCIIPGCQIPAPYTQPHHVSPWNWEGPTDQENLASCCWVHHRQVELGLLHVVRRQIGQEPPPGVLEHPHWWVIPQPNGYRQRAFTGQGDVPGQEESSGRSACSA